MAGQDGLEDMQFDDELESFLSGKGGAVPSGMANLQPQAFGTMPDVPTGKMDQDEESAGGSAGAMAAAVSAAAAAGATALMAGKLGEGLGGGNSAAAAVIGSVAAAAVPTSLAPVKEQAGKFLQKAQPWREFFLPVSIPAGSESCTRVTGNLYVYQTNYAILFMLQLVLAIVFEPSALVSIVVTVLAWMGFLKKNDDPDWHPEVGGMKLGPTQRWIAMAGMTAMVLLLLCGSTIIHAAFVFLLAAVAHGVIHDPNCGSQSLPGSGGDVADSL